ncbi:MAG: hypothetical protein WCI79_01810 [Candidatus Saccharibacteria bacterium]
MNKLIQGYLQATGFILEDKNSEQFYKAGDAMVGYKYFKYELSGQTLTVYAWLKSLLGEISVEQNSLNMLAMNYRDSLNKLFQEISNLNNLGKNMDNNEQKNNTSNVSNIPQNQTVQQPVQNDPNQVAQTFQAETDKKKETMCEIGFWLSIFGLLISFVGISFGVIIYIMDFYFASQGLKTRKKGKAVTTIILSALSIVVTISLLIFGAKQ